MPLHRCHCLHWRAGGGGTLWGCVGRSAVCGTMQLRTARPATATATATVQGYKRQVRDLENEVLALRGELERKDEQLAAVSARHREAHKQISELQQELESNAGARRAASMGAGGQVVVRPPHVCTCAQTGHASWHGGLCYCRKHTRATPPPPEGVGVGSFIACRVHCDVCSWACSEKQLEQCP